MAQLDFRVFLYIRSIFGKRIAKMVTLPIRQNGIVTKNFKELREIYAPVNGDAYSKPCEFLEKLFCILYLT